jgi:uridine kinase
LVEGGFLIYLLLCLLFSLFPLVLIVRTYKELRISRKANRIRDDRIRQFEEYLDRLVAEEIADNYLPIVHNWKDEGF